ncbi:hypothetical protein ABT234_01600 [Streptomyces sp. NPDC001586]|uniref:hypothetical protein n=1 Tax=unclassified Streptomyces TaxID=2593676 RepID=UPI00332753CC
MRTLAWLAHREGTAVRERVGGKGTKAEELGIRILDPEEFAALVADLLPTT